MQNKIPARVQVMMNEDNKLELHRQLGDPAFGFPEKGSRDAHSNIHILVEVDKRPWWSLSWLWEGELQERVRLVAKKHI